MENRIECSKCRLDTRRELRTALSIIDALFWHWLMRRCSICASCTLKMYLPWICAGWSWFPANRKNALICAECSGHGFLRCPPLSVCIHGARLQKSTKTVISMMASRTLVLWQVNKPYIIQTKCMTWKMQQICGLEVYWCYDMLRSHYSFEDFDQNCPYHAKVNARPFENDADGS